MGILDRERLSSIDSVSSHRPVTHTADFVFDLYRDAETDTLSIAVLRKVSVMKLLSSHLQLLFTEENKKYKLY